MIDADERELGAMGNDSEENKETEPKRRDHNILPLDKLLIAPACVSDYKDLTRQDKLWLAVSQWNVKDSPSYLLVLK